MRARPAPGDIDVLFHVAGGSRTDPSRTPAVPFPLPVRDVREAGRPDAPSPGGSLAITAGMPWPRRGCSPGEDVTMSAPNAHHGNRPHPAGADAQSLVLLRDQAGIAGQTAHTVHLAPLPQLSGMPRRVVLPVPDPQFPIQTPAGRRSSTPVPPCAPGGQSVPLMQPGPFRETRADTQRHWRVFGRRG